MVEGRITLDFATQKFFTCVAKFSVILGSNCFIRLGPGKVLQSFAVLFSDGY